MTKAKLSVDTTDLYNAKEISAVRALLTKEQNGLSALTGLPLTTPVTDHCHTAENHQLVRAVINSKENVALGRIEGLYARYIGYWYEGTYPEFLRLVADYIERGVDRRYRHSMWIAKINTMFFKLSTAKQDELLVKLGQPKGKNQKDRKKYLQRVILSKNFGYTALREMIETTDKGTSV